MPRRSKSPSSPKVVGLEEQGFRTPSSNESQAILPLKRVRNDDQDTSSLSDENTECKSPRLSPRRLDMDDSDRVVLASEAGSVEEDEERVELTQVYESGEPEEGEISPPPPLVRTTSEAL